MRAIKHIIILTLALLSSFSATAQVTAVMQAKVEIISGAALTVTNQPVIHLSETESSEFEAANFSLSASPGSDVNISINQNTRLVNEQGEAVDLEGIQLSQQGFGNGNKSVSVKGKVSGEEGLSGSYQGTITAVVEYL